MSMDFRGDPSSAMLEVLGQVVDVAEARALVLRQRGPELAQILRQLAAHGIRGKELREPIRVCVE
jgi:hypothetical protein